MTWILILSMYYAPSWSKGASVASVGGFESREACLAAGNAWLKKVADPNGYGQFSALCVPSR